jgi:nitronate monooxygenase
VVERLRAAGSEIWITVTSPDEAGRAAESGADALVVQGSEAGGHRGGFSDEAGIRPMGLLALLQLVGARTDLPLVATGGIATGAALAAVLATGARAGQLGSAFMLCPEAGTPPAHREALRSSRETALTRAFTGRTARGIRNSFMEQHDEAACLAYPEIHFVTAPMRRNARISGDESLINLWAGEAHQLASENPAADIVRQLAADATAATRRAAS